MRHEMVLQEFELRTKSSRVKITFHVVERFCHLYCHLWTIRAACWH